MNKPVFIVGLPRSGSTLLLNVLSRHSTLFRIPEMHFLNPWRKDFKYFIRHNFDELCSDKDLSKIIEYLFSTQTIPGLTGIFWIKDLLRMDSPGLRQKLSSRISKTNCSLGSIFKAIIEEVTYEAGFNRCCVKFPVYVNYVPKLIEWYPECKIIHVTRDPRAVAISRMNDPGGAQKKIQKYKFFGPAIKKGMMAFVIFQYIWTARLHAAFKKNPNYILLKYEELLKQPEVTVRDMCDFLELKFENKMLRSRKGEYAQHSSITGKQITEFDPEAAYRWLKVIKKLDLMTVTLLTKTSMLKFGYEKLSIERTEAEFTNA